MKLLASGPQHSNGGFGLTIFGKVIIENWTIFSKVMHIHVNGV